MYIIFINLIATYSFVSFIAMAPIVLPQHRHNIDGNYGHPPAISRNLDSVDKGKVEDMPVPSAGRAEADSGNSPKDVFIEGTYGDDRIISHGGNDAIEGLRGRDVMLGGAGLDTLVYWRSAEAVSINLEFRTANGGHAEGDAFVDIENLYGSKHNDTLIGDAYHNVLSGYDGADIIKGGPGNDVIEGGEGDDLLYGGPGRDTFVFDAARTDHDIIVDFEVGIDTLKFSTASSLPNHANFDEAFVQDGTNIVIEFGYGSKITLLGIDVNEFWKGLVSIVPKIERRQFLQSWQRHRKFGPLREPSGQNGAEHEMRCKCDLKDF